MEPTWRSPAEATAPMSARKAFPLRLSPELYEELRRWADSELRSVNGQIEFLLRQAVRERRRDRGGSATRNGGAGAGTEAEPEPD